MNLFRTIIISYLISIPLFSQQGTIDIFPKNIIREDFNNQNPMFPTLTNSDGQYAIIVDSLGYYGLGSLNSAYPLLMSWDNDLIDFELKISTRLKNEPNSFVIQKLQGETGQTIGLILKYNADNQEAFIFEINGVKQYRLSYLKNEKLRSLTGDWKYTENLRRNDKNEIIIKTKNHQYEFYINGVFEFRKNLAKFQESLEHGDFGFYVGSNTQAMIDYFYISAPKNYNGINAKLNLTQKETQKLIEENQKLKTKFQHEREKANQELKEVIQILEIELKSSNEIKDSLKKEIEKYLPFKNLLEQNGDFMYTLTKDLKRQMESNQILKNENKLLLDSINILIFRQDEFKLEYLRVLDSMMEKKDTMNENY